jgi:trigger factor
LKVNNEKTENSQAYLTIEMEPSEMEASLEKSYRRLVKRVDVPGFRRGKAPRAVLERHIGYDSLLQDTVDELVPEAYEKAIKEQAIEAIARPQIEVVQTDPIIFKAVVPLKPVIKLGDYLSVRIDPEPVEVTEGDIDSVIEQLRHQHATWEPVQRSVDFGDLLTLDVESTVDDMPFINQKGAQYQVVRDSPAPAPGFAEQLVGMSKAEKKEFSLDLPSDYPRSEFAGKTASFKITVTEIKQENLPEVTDDFAQQVDPDFKTLANLREKASADLKARADQIARRNFEDKVIEAVVELSEVEFPPVLVEVEIDRTLERNLQFMQSGGRGLEQYLKSINKTLEELREELRPEATKRVAQSLVLGRIAEEEKVEVSPPEIDNEIEEMTKNATENKDALKRALNTPQARESIEQRLFSRKTVERLLEIARGSVETNTAQKEDEK